MIAQFPSRKMGKTISAESRRGEFAYIVLLERDDDVMAYFEQPPAVDCKRTNRRGVVVTRSYTPDVVVWRSTGPEIIQVKSQQRLAEMVANYPTDWICVDGVYRDLPAERAFEQIGLLHKIVSAASMSPTRVANMQLLLRVEWSEEQYCAVDTEKLIAAFRAQAVMTLAALTEAIDIVALTPLLTLIAAGTLHADLDRQLLADPASCLVSLLPQLLDPIVMGDMAGSPDASVPLELCPPEKQAAQGLAKLEAFRCRTMAPRTFRRHQAAVLDGSKNGKTAFQVLAPKTYRSGNKRSKRPPQILDHAERAIRTHYGNSRRLTSASIYRLYCTEAREKFPDAAPLSRQSIAKLIEKVRTEAALDRGGKRLANAQDAPTDVYERVVPPMRPFELATCDHYLLDIHCVVLRSNGRTYTRKPWLTVLRDVYSGAVLSLWLGFRSPSRIACAMVIRSCLRRHGRLPEAIVVDRGAEFRSVFFSALLAHCRMIYFSRPSSHPRYGSEAERFYGAYKSLWLNLRPGNTTIHVEARSVSGSHSAQSNAELDLDQVLSEFWAYCDWSHSVVAPQMTQPPELALIEGLARFPFSGVQIPYDSAFEVATAVDARHIRLDPQRGLQVGRPFFWHPVLSQPNLIRKHIEVRCDPEDHTRVHVRVGGLWVKAVSAKHPVMRSKSQVQRISASVISLEGGAERDFARRDADHNLVNLVRQEDARRASTKQQSMPELPDFFEDDDSEDVGSDLPDVSNWSDRS